MNAKKIIFVDSKLEDSFVELSGKDPIKKALMRAIGDIKENVHAGRNVKKNLIPKELIEKYGVNNIWIYNLPSAWRLIYSVTTSEEVEIIAVILNWMSHKDYEKLFRF